MGWTRRNIPISSLLSLTLVLGLMAGRATRAEAQSAGATVRASVTILDAVGVASGSSSLQMLDSGSGPIRIGGSLEVTSPVPHILTSSLGPADLPWVEGQYSHVRAGTDGAVPQRVDVTLDRAGEGRPMKLVYTVAVLL